MNGPSTGLAAGSSGLPSWMLLMNSPQRPIPKVLPFENFGGVVAVNWRWLATSWPKPRSLMVAMMIEALNLKSPAKPTNHHKQHCETRNGKKSL